MDHRFVMTFVDEYLSGTIEPRDRILYEECLAAHPQLRAWVAEEKKLKGYLGNLVTPQPDDNYWLGLENQILQKATENESLPPTADSTPEINRSFFPGRYLIPLAAVFTALLWSFSLPPSRVVRDTVDAPSALNAEYTQLADNTLEAELMGSTILGPPGAVSRMILLKSLDGKY